MGSAKLQNCKKQWKHFLTHLKSFFNVNKRQSQAKTIDQGGIDTQMGIKMHQSESEAELA